MLLVEKERGGGKVHGGSVGEGGAYRKLVFRQRRRSVREANKLTIDVEINGGRI